MKVKITIATSIGIIFAEVVEAESTGAALLEYQRRPEVADQLTKLRYAPWCFQADCFDPLPDARLPGEVQRDVAQWRSMEAAWLAANPEPEEGNNALL